jgi:DNA-directed RNA polymerase subunit E'/Rpb7
MQIISPYKNVKQSTNISVEPYHLNSDIRNNMFNILKKKVEKKCNSYGYIDEVHKIMEYGDGQMAGENLSGNIIYNILYHCRLCLPVVNTTIIGQVKVISSEVIVCINGPIMIFVTKDNIDTNIWDNNDGYVDKKSKEKLVVGSYIKITILNIQINQGDNIIKSMGLITDIPTTDEITKYYGPIITETNDNSFIM